MRFLLAFLLGFLAHALYARWAAWERGERIWKGMVLAERARLAEALAAKEVPGWLP